MGRPRVASPARTWPQHRIPHDLDAALRRYAGVVGCTPSEALHAILRAALPDADVASVERPPQHLTQ